MPNFELDAIVAHTVNLLNCNLRSLPLEVLTDSFLTSYGLVCPVSLREYSDCVKANDTGIYNAHFCNDNLKSQFREFDGVAEILQFERLHNEADLGYDVNINEELKRDPDTFPEKDLRERQSCLQNIQRRVSTCIDKLIQKCQNSEIRAAKLIRVKMSTAERILDVDPSIKVLHYTRDPRGTLESRFRRFRWFEQTPYTQLLAKEASLLCSRIKDDMDSLKHIASVYGHNALSLKYEDIVTDYKAAVNKVYDFIGRPLPRDVLTHFEGMMGGLGKEGRALETFRKNATNMNGSLNTRLRLRSATHG